MLKFLENMAIGLESVGMIFSHFLGFVGILIIIFGSIKALFHFLETLHGKYRTLHGIRLELGRHLVLGLEFLVGKDILASLVSPTWDELGKLAIIVSIRTVLAIFLGREMKEAERAIKEEQAARVQEKKKQKA